MSSKAKKKTGSAKKAPANCKSPERKFATPTTPLSARALNFHPAGMVTPKSKKKSSLARQQRYIEDFVRELSAKKKTNASTPKNPPIGTTSKKPRLAQSLSADERHEWIQKFVNSANATPTRVDFHKSPLSNEIITTLPDSSPDTPANTVLSQLIKKFEEPPKSSLVQVNFEKVENDFVVDPEPAPLSVVEPLDPQPSTSKWEPDSLDAVTEKIDNLFARYNSLNSLQSSSSSHDWNQMEKLYVTRRTPARKNSKRNSTPVEIITLDDSTEPEIAEHGLRERSVMVISDSSDVEVLEEEEGASARLTPKKTRTTDSSEEVPSAGTHLGDCPICFEKLGGREVSATVCGHVFCTPCIRTAQRVNKKCPNCRKRLFVKHIIPLYV